MIESSFFNRVEAIALRVGPQVTRYAIVFRLLVFGAAKWAAGEAHARRTRSVAA